MVLVGFRVLGLACYVLSPHDGTAHRNHQNLSEPSEPQCVEATVCAVTVSCERSEGGSESV